MSTTDNKHPYEEPNSTLSYYNANADEYFEATQNVDMSGIYDRFLHYIPKGGRILDAGSGSGRDTLAFLKKGYELDAFDASPELVALSTKHTGVRAKVIRFQEFESLEAYDGIWACASLLHVPQAELRQSMIRLISALKPGGALYVSFKLGAGERTDSNHRFFLDMDEATLRDIVGSIPKTRVSELWISSGEGMHQGKNAWLNAIILKQEKDV